MTSEAKPCEVEKYIAKCAFCGEAPDMPGEIIYCDNHECANFCVIKNSALAWNPYQRRIAAHIRESNRKAIEFAMQQVDYGSPEETKCAIAQTFADWEREK